jgi:hypothetical protein
VVDRTTVTAGRINVRIRSWDMVKLAAIKLQLGQLLSRYVADIINDVSG